MMHSDSRVKEPVCLATTSLPDPCLSTYLSPRFREEPEKRGRRAGLALAGGRQAPEGGGYLRLALAKAAAKALLPTGS